MIPDRPQRSCLPPFRLATDLSDFNEELHRRVLDSPVDCLPAFEDAFESTLREQDGADKVGRSLADTKLEGLQGVIAVQFSYSGWRLGLCGLGFLAPTPLPTPVSAPLPHATSDPSPSSHPPNLNRC